MLEDRLSLPPAPLKSLRKELQTDPKSLIHRRVLIEGQYDFEHEMLIRNRRLDDRPGFHVITPLKLSFTEDFILVNRGFIPLESGSKDIRSDFQQNKEVHFLGLIKEGVARRLLAPSDPPAGDGLAWVDAWLRVDIEKMNRQLPYRLLPIYAEVMSLENPQEVKSSIVRSDSGREELLFLPSRAHPAEIKERENTDYPTPVFEMVVPAGRHFGYVFEWGFMALGTFLMCIVLQLRPPRGR